MAQPDIPLSEFARRLCVATHPGFGSTGSPVPCGTHTRDAQRYWGLLGDEGTTAFGIIGAIRAEGAGRRVDERTDVIRRLITAASKIRGDEPGLAEALDECERALGLRPERGGADG